MKIYSKKAVFLVIIGVIMLSNPVLADVIFEDSFDRGDSGTVGNSWVEQEGSGTVNISSNTLKILDNGGSTVSVNQSGFTTPDEYNITVRQKHTDNSEASAFFLKSDDTTHIDFRFHSNGSMTCCNNNDNGLSLYSSDTYYTIRLAVNKSSGNVEVFSDEVSQGNFSLQNSGTTTHNRVAWFTTGGGVNDALYVDWVNITNSTAVGDPYAHVRAQDLYDDANLEGLTVTLADGTSNTTDSSGIAYFYNKQGQGFNITDPDSLYYTFTGGTAVENATTTQKVYGAFVNLTGYDLAETLVSTFNTSSGSQTNETTTGSVVMFLRPNASNTVEVTSPDYLPINITVSTTGQDTNSYNLSGLYESLLTVQVEIGTTGSYVQNHTTNVTGIEVTQIDYETSTTNYNTTYGLMYGNYTITSDPENYAIITAENYSIAEGNNSPEITLRAYAINSFFMDFLDEITENSITENMTLELISSGTAGTYTTTNGTLDLEILVPADYTIRYKSTAGGNYTERDYYQTLVAQNYYSLDLYSIQNSESTDMVVTVKDTAGDPVEDATVKLMRYYTSCNCYNVVEMSKTSFSGEAYFVVDAYDGHYKFAIDYEGINRFLSTSPENFIPVSGLVERSLTINLGSAYFQSYREFTDIGRSLVYNNDTKALTFTWSDSSGIVTSGCLYASYLDGVHYTDVTPACQNSSTGSVFLVLNNSARSYKYYAEIETSTTYSAYTAFSGVLDEIKETLLSDVRVAGFLGGIMVVGLALLFSFSAIAVVIVTALGIIAMGALGLAPLSTNFILGFAAIIIGMAAYTMRS